jgi:hypothetical protein
MRQHLSTIAIAIGVGLIVHAANAFAVAQHSNIVQDFRWWVTVVGLLSSGATLSIAGGVAQRSSIAGGDAQRPATAFQIPPLTVDTLSQVKADIDAFGRLNRSLGDHPQKDGVLKPIFDAIYDTRFRKPAAEGGETHVS